VRAKDLEDVERYRYAARHHSRPDLRACAACKALAWQGKRPTAKGVAKLADVELSLAEEIVDLWHGRRPLEVTRPGAVREVVDWGEGPRPGLIHVGARALEAAADLTDMAGGPLHPQRRRRRGPGKPAQLS
jgi:hypothetical protein